MSPVPTVRLTGCRMVRGWNCLPMKPCRLPEWIFAQPYRLMTRLILEPGASALIETGFAMALPAGF